MWIKLSCIRVFCSTFSIIQCLHWNVYVCVRNLAERPPCSFRSSVRRTVGLREIQEQLDGFCCNFNTAEFYKQLLRHSNAMLHQISLTTNIHEGLPACLCVTQYIFVGRKSVMNKLRSENCNMCNIWCSIVSKIVRSTEKKNWIRNMCSSFLCIFCQKHFSRR
jgi:hypothetical protein